MWIRRKIKRRLMEVAHFCESRKGKSWFGCGCRQISSLKIKDKK